MELVGLAVVAVVAAAAAIFGGAHQRFGARTEDGRREMAEVRSALGKMEALVHEMERDREAKFGELAAQLRAAGQQTAALTDTAGRRREALAGTKSRGQRAERMAEDVLRAVGTVEHVNYR